MSSCEVCGITLRSDNRSGLCCNRSRPACTRERQRREALRAAAATGVRCLCGCLRADHALGEGLEACGHRACGCGEFRLDARSRTGSEDEAGIAATGTDG